MQGFGVFTVLKGLKAFQAKFVSSHFLKKNYAIFRFIYSDDNSWQCYPLEKRELMEINQT